MSPTPGVRVLKESSVIGTGIDIREQCQDSEDATSPNVILIFGWMGAQLGHLQNYTHAYTKLYPNASQIVVQCNPDMFWIPISTRQRRLMPVIDALEALHCLPSSSPTQRPPRILTHVFSNGGSLQMTLLGHMLQRKYGSASVHGSFTGALILDSCPTALNLKALKRSFNSAIRNPILRSIILTFIYTVFVVRFGLSLLFGKDMMLVKGIQTDMWNPRILPWMSLHTPRIYLFSRKDKLIPWQEVVQHAETAKERGMDVRCELFEESGHVRHALVEPERYWSLVQEVWVVAISKEKGKARMSQAPPARQRHSFL
ncbi:uncharacterized protein EDB91DRAFT_1138953 [Suillus paluster]|uniref:uncharacterized protein n=1 Tax=Suillus paluster TaxID=48578 RepID=UPI001B870252|nr:uncharacterized protein EDB91DRAFT_1141226 [Suillus paluster]XP_041176424.1 uncharacterized protein EDB91DRAFT_1138953 [Suillus paluster]KAG1737159.1 hypothetical protein EDB91DRAFT_1141226 [Suillus paluster]KAG1738451.1 hypothetical protein EDB91DRAFT_1138953 [Suillus paluster]